MDFDFNLETITPDLTTVLTIGGTGCLQLPSGTTAQEPGTAVAGAMRWNTSLTRLEYYTGAAWASFSTGGTVTSVSGSGGTTGLTLTGGAITTSGTLTLGGTLIIANGGTGQTTAPAAFSALSPITTTGDIIYSSAGTTNSRLGIGTTGQVLTVASGLPSWSTVGAASFAVNVGPSGTIAWSLVSGNTYNAVITHNLGTVNVVVQAADTTTNQILNTDVVTITSATQITVQVVGNTRTLRVVIIANGASIAAGASTPSSIIVQNQGVGLTGTYTTLNFTAGFTATNAGGGVANVTQSIIKQFTFYPASLDTPNNSDWVVNSSAPSTPDPVSASLLVRSFSTSVEGGVGAYVTVPSNATQVTLNFKGRAQTAPGAAAVIQPKLYVRSIPNNAALAAWGAANVLSVQTVPTNAFFQYYTQAATALATYGLAAGGQYLLELTLSTAPTSGTNLASNWLMTEFTVSFS